MIEGRYKILSFPRAGALAPAALAAALLGTVLLPLLAFGAEPAKAPGKAAAKQPKAKAPAAAAAAGTAAADLRSTDRKRRRAAAEKILRGKDRATGAQVQEALDKEADKDIKLKLLRAAGRSGDATGLSALVDTLEWDADPTARLAAAQELGRLRGGPGAEASLAEALLHDTDPGVREACAAGLMFYDGASSAAALAQAAASGDEGAAGMARLALDRRRARSGGRP